MGKKKQHREGVVRMDNGVLCSQSQGGGEITYFFHKGLGDYGKSLVGVLLQECLRNVSGETS